MPPFLHIINPAQNTRQTVNKIIPFVGFGSENLIISLKNNLCTKYVLSAPLPHSHHINPRARMTARTLYNTKIQPTTGGIIIIIQFNSVTKLLQVISSFSSALGIALLIFFTLLLLISVLLFAVSLINPHWGPYQPIA